MIFRFFGSFALSTGLLASCRSYSVFRRDFVNPFHPRAVEKCGCGREGGYCVAMKPSGSAGRLAAKMEFQ